MKPEAFQIEWLKRHPVGLHLKFDPWPTPGTRRGVKPARKKVPKVRKGRPFREKAVDRVVHGMGPEHGPSLRKAIRRYLATRGKSKVERIE